MEREPRVSKNEEDMKKNHHHRSGNRGIIRGDLCA